MTTQNLPAVRNDNGQKPVDGLEDLDPNEVAIPRVRIKHKDGVFEDALSGEQFPKVYGVVMGLVKQRIKWKGTVSEGKSTPQCKSSDNITGYPAMEAADPDDLFPWKEVGLDPDVQPRDQYGRVTMACDSCPLSKWGPRDAKGKAKPPPCKERYTLPIMYSTEPGSPIDRAGIFSFQGAGIGPWKQYFAGFQRSKRPVYSAITEIGLEIKHRGQVDYSVPTVARISATREEDYQMYSDELAGIRTFLRRAPRVDGDDDPNEDAEIVSEPAAQPAQHSGLNIPGMQTTAPAQATNVTVQGQVMESTPPATTLNDDLPF